jgi:hypothetical protein
VGSGYKFIHGRHTDLTIWFKINRAGFTLPFLENGIFHLRLGSKSTAAVILFLPLQLRSLSVESAVVTGAVSGVGVSLAPGLPVTSVEV